MISQGLRWLKGHQGKETQKLEHSLLKRNTSTRITGLISHLFAFFPVTSKQCVCVRSTTPWSLSNNSRPLLFLPFLYVLRRLLDLVSRAALDWSKKGQDVNSKGFLSTPNPQNVILTSFHYKDYCSNDSPSARTWNLRVIKVTFHQLKQFKSLHEELSTRTLHKQTRAYSCKKKKKKDVPTRAHKPTANSWSSKFIVNKLTLMHLRSVFNYLWLCQNEIFVCAGNIPGYFWVENLLVNYGVFSTGKFEQSHQQTTGASHFDSKWPASMDGSQFRAAWFVWCYKHLITRY